MKSICSQSTYAPLNLAGYKICCLEDDNTLTFKTYYHNNGKESVHLSINCIWVEDEDPGKIRKCVDYKKEPSKELLDLYWEEVLDELKWFKENVIKANRAFYHEVCAMILKYGSVDLVQRLGL